MLLLLFYEMANEKVLLSVIIYLDFLVSISNSGCKSSPLGGECSMQSPDEVHERCEHKIVHIQGTVMIIQMNNTML